MRAFMFEASLYDTARLLEHWRWLIPQVETPLMISVFGDWVFGHPDGTLWRLELLEGRYQRIRARRR